MEHNHHVKLNNNQKDPHPTSYWIRKSSTVPQNAYSAKHQPPITSDQNVQSSSMAPKIYFEWDDQTTTSRPSWDSTTNTAAVHKTNVDNETNNWLTWYWLKEWHNQKFNPTTKDRETRPEVKQTDSFRKTRFRGKDPTWRRPKRARNNKNKRRINSGYVRDRENLTTDVTWTTRDRYSVASTRDFRNQTT